MAWIGDECLRYGFGVETGKTQDEINPSISLLNLYLHKPEIICSATNNYLF